VRQKEGKLFRRLGNAYAIKMKTTSKKVSTPTIALKIRLASFFSLFNWKFIFLNVQLISGVIKEAI
jgi:hypothetical protein